MHTMIPTRIPLGFILGFSLSALHELLSNREESESSIVA
jgi:hypothetical protein